jgi:GntR family transcriptional regulator / MocR family aminotransferase
MKHVPRTLEIALMPKQKGMSSREWLRDSIRQAILTGAVKPGYCLPSSRDLSKAYRLARTTVLLALEDLRGEGYLKSIRGAGTYVSEDPPDTYLRSAAPCPPPRTTQRVVQVSNFAKRLRSFSHFVNPRTIAFRTNLPALDLFPIDLWSQTVSRRLRRASTAMLLGTEPQGYPPLRQVLAEYLRAARAVRCDPEQIFITSGIQESLDLTTRILINPGDRVLMEDPGYQVAFNGFQAAGARITSMRIDQNGAIPPSRSYARARLLYVTPAHQFPTGATMPLSRRQEILRYAQHEALVIFEDDYDSEFRYSGSPPQSLQNIDHYGSVIFAGSFNKLLFPSLRLGYVVVPPNLIEPFKICKAIQTRHHSLLDQAVICDFIEQGHFSRHIRRMRKIYGERLRALIYEAQRQLHGVVELSDIEAGLQTVARLTNGQCAEAVTAEGLKRNVDVIPISRYCRAAKMPSHLQLGFAAVDPDAIRRGVQVLASILT